MRYIACGRKPNHFGIKDSQAHCISLLGTITHQLHSQTNPQYRLCQLRDKCIQLRTFEFRHRRTRLPYSWENDMRSRLNSFWITRQCGRNPQTFQSKTNALDIPSPIIDNGYTHNCPLVEGRINFSGSRCIAALMVLAKLLKIASILWCSLCPSALMFKLAFAPSAKDLKK